MAKDVSVHLQSTISEEIAKLSGHAKDTAMKAWKTIEDAWRAVEPYVNAVIDTALVPILDVLGKMIEFLQKTRRLTAG